VNFEQGGRTDLERVGKIFYNQYKLYSQAAKKVSCKHREAGALKKCNVVGEEPERSSFP